MTVASVAVARVGYRGLLERESGVHGIASAEVVLRLYLIAVRRIELFTRYIQPYALGRRHRVLD